MDYKKETISGFVKSNSQTIITLFIIAIFLNFLINNCKDNFAETFDGSGDFYKNMSKFITLDYLIDPKSGNFLGMEWHNVAKPDMRNLNKTFDYNKSHVVYNYGRDLDDKAYIDPKTKKLIEIAGANSDKDLSSDLGVFTTESSLILTGNYKDGTVQYKFNPVTGKSDIAVGVYSLEDKKFISIAEFKRKYPSKTLIEGNGIVAKENFAPKYNSDFGMSSIFGLEDTYAFPVINSKNFDVKYLYGKNRYIDDPMFKATQSTIEDFRDNARSMKRVKNCCSRNRNQHAENFIENAQFSDDFLSQKLNRSINIL